MNYAYLWHHEHLAGIEEERRDRPSVIVLCVTNVEGGAPTATVLLITHSKPANPTLAIQVPPAIKRHLGLDGARSCIVLFEVNGFAWSR